MPNKRPSIPKNIQLEVYRRDKWTCRYCGFPVFFNPSLKLLNELNPNHGYFDNHGKLDNELDLFAWGMASVDHINPYARGGEDSIKNYATACWKCNLYYRDAHVEVKLFALKKQEKQNKIKINVGWDGLSGLYAKLSGKKDKNWLILIQ